MKKTLLLLFPLMIFISCEDKEGEEYHPLWVLGMLLS
jgi:hypothetical protein